VEGKVDGFVKTIFPSFLDTLPREEWVAGGVTEGARRATGVTPPRVKKYHPFLFSIRLLKKCL